MIRLATKYLVSHIFKYVLAFSLGLLFIFLSNQFVRFLSSAASDALSEEVIKWILLFQIPTLLTLILSVALYLAIILVYGRLAEDNELVILQMSGMSIKNFTKINLSVAFWVTLLTMFLSFFVNPRLHKYIEWLSKSGYSASMIKPQQFNYLGKDKTWLIYIRNFDRKNEEYQRVFIKELSRNCLIVADRAKIIDKYQFILFDGEQYCGTFGQTEIEYVKFEKQSFFIKPSLHAAKDEAGKSNMVLWQSRKNARLGAELFWRISSPMMVLILSLLATPLSYLSFRRGKYSRLGWATFFYVFYANGLFLTRAFLQKGSISFGWTAFTIHGLMLMVAGFFYWCRRREW